MASADPFQAPYVVNVDPPGLPKTVTRLTTEFGSFVYLVGTAHFSRESCEDVATTIDLVRPNVVLLELCTARTGVVALDESEMLEEAKTMNLQKLRSNIQAHGFTSGIVSSLLLLLTAHITKELGMAPGGEFRTAYKHACGIAGCRIVCGDRPIQITLTRIIRAMSLWQKCKFGWYLLTCRDPISKEDVEKCKDKDLLQQLLEQFAGEYPEVTEVLVNERDQYLVHSLRKAAQPVHSRLIGGPEPIVVVGVVGMGHVLGIVSNWDKKIDIKSLVSIPKPSVVGRVISVGIKIGFYGLCIYGVYRLGKTWKLI
ncbi:traB domain-containing protein-like [Corticium candelabrum]|uniref:traB domain-containing protein-like n=1 Tax=Corticium candelabrum TaxID=121492 RepID=UPI002E26386C|nr:traB domain-containing protein-like [Corticium candelabrum]